MQGAFLIMVLLSGLVLAVNQPGMLATQPEVDKAAQINYLHKYQDFVRYSHAYMKANPSATGSVFWASIKTAGPAAVQDATYPADWKLVADGSGGFVICTPFPDKQTAVGIERHLLGERTEKAVPVNTNKVVIGDPANPSGLATEAAKCI